MLAERTNSSSPSPSRRLSIGSKISALGAKLSRTLSHSDDPRGEESDLVTPILHNTERSISRGREAFHSTGRGGIGNIRQASVSRDRPSPGTGPEDFSVTRGREPIANPNQIFSTGRGGAGNLRSPSRDPKPRAEIEEAEKEVIREYVAAHEGAVHSTGRGGIGNINRSRSRDPTSTSGSAAPSTISSAKFSTGRGGAGNILAGDSHLAETIDEQERRNHPHSTEGLHSTGRGGAANITAAHEPAIEHHPHHHHGQNLTPEFESTGRGGVGNIVRDRSASRQRT